MMRTSVLLLVLSLTTPASAQMYPESSALSPLGPDVVARLRQLVESYPNNRNDTIIKVGDSSTVNAGFMQCFAGNDIDLAGRSHLLDTIRYFHGFNRSSQAAEVGWSSVHVLRGGAESPLSKELRDLRPRFAFIMFGTNDIEGRRVDRFAHWMWQILERTTGRGTIPILSAMPPRNDDAEADALVPEWNLVLRGLASGMRVPFVDVHREMSVIPTTRGLADDGYHPSTFWGRGPRGCVFTPQGLQYGQNVRNRLNIEMLHALREVVLGTGNAPDRALATLRGRGTHAEPFELPSLPFTTIQDGRAAESTTTQYSCDASIANGSEQLYRFSLRERTNVTALALGRTRQIDLNLYLMGGDANPTTCRAFGERRLNATLEAGTYTIAVDGAGARGDYLFAIRGA